MCVADNSVDLYTSTCPMCKVFRNTSRCAHKREICRNRVNHPRHDVVYISNAEVSTFKGCGYCKWATTIPPPPPNKSGMHNPGWPGCCRPPQSSELERIPPADWHAVQTVHKTPMPPEIRQLLDAITRGSYFSGNATSSSIGNNTSPTNTNGGSNKDWSIRSLQSTERKSISRTVGSSPNGTVRSPPSKSRPPIPNGAFGSGNSPKTKNSRLGATANTGTSPAGNADSLLSSLNNSNMNSNPSTGSAYNSVRRGSVQEPHTPLKRIEGFRTTPPSSVRRLDSGPIGSGTPPGPATTNSSKQLTSLTIAAVSSLNSSNGTTVNESQPVLKRRSSAASTMPLTIATNRNPNSSKSSGGKNSIEMVLKIASEKERGKEKDKAREKSENICTTNNGNGIEKGLEKGLKALQISANGNGATYHLDSGLPTPTTPSTPSTPNSDSSSSSGESHSTSSSSSSEGTVTSDGGFTDYLSDESEAELQRQAEARAAQVARDRMEEIEFRMARKQLANVDLKPPQSWTTGVRKPVGMR